MYLMQIKQEVANFVIKMCLFRPCDKKNDTDDA